VETSWRSGQIGRRQSMNEPPAQSLVDLVPARRGHFRLESGHHSAMWLDLDGLFVEPDRVAPMVSELTRALRPHQPAGVCGPLLGGAFLAQLVSLALGVDFYYTERLPPEDDGLYRAQYRLPRALRRRVHGQRVAIVDDVMSAGSAARGTYAELQALGAHPVAVGALLVLGTAGLTFFDQQGVPVEAAVKLPYDIWPPPDCPLCSSGVPLEDIGSG
jgi:orotate phosphoribosyltransferase